MKRLATILALVLAAASFGAIVLGTTAATASDPSVNTTIGQGNNGDNIGDATLTRSLLSNGTETIHIELTLTTPGAEFGQVHVCVSDTDFTSRIPPGQCEFGFENLSGTTFNETVNIGDSFVGKEVCLQIQADVLYQQDGQTVQQTAFVNWHDGSPFYGNICLPSVETQVPVGAVGAVGLAGVTGVGLVARQRRRRRPAA